MSSLSGCAHIDIPVEIQDAPLYYIKGVPNASPAENYAVEMHFLTTGQTQLTKSDWDVISQGMVCMPLSSFDDFNKEIAKLCSQHKCDYETQQKFKALVVQLHEAGREK